LHDLRERLIDLRNSRPLGNSSASREAAISDPEHELANSRFEQLITELEGLSADETRRLIANSYNIPEALVEVFVNMPNHTLILLLLSRSLHRRGHDNKEK
jgi:hypothetical protein